MAYAIGHRSCCHLNPAVSVGLWTVSQLWLFWLAPIVGGVLGAVACCSATTGVFCRNGHKNTSATDIE